MRATPKRWGARTRHWRRQGWPARAASPAGSWGAIGGIAKGHMVREIDALGGVMGIVTDRAGIQFKMLNRGRGPAVWSPRAQCDKARYSLEMTQYLESISGLTRVCGVANHVRLEGGAVRAIELSDGRMLFCRAAVVTPGTFLNGLIHHGPQKSPGG